jgi:phage terminase large subunit-like protein
VEIIWDGASAAGALVALGCECHTGGDTIRAVIAQDQLEAALDGIRRARGRLISVTPVRASLEDYFLEKLNEFSSAVEVNPC